MNAVIGCAVDIAKPCRPRQIRREVGGTGHGRRQLAECLRAELAGSRIFVSVVYPVSTDTEFFDVMTQRTGVEVARAFGPRQDAATVANAIARAIEHPTPEVYPHFNSRFLVVLNAIAPGLTDRIVKRFGRKPIR